MNEILERMSKIGIIPVVVLNNAKDAQPLAKALCTAGLPCAEVTFRTDAAEESIKIMSRQFPDMLVGAGTILTIEQVDRAVSAGAKFIVSPGFNPSIVKYCIDKKIPITPGAINPSDVAKAVELGLEVVKFFPAEQAGGLPMIKAMCSAYTKIKFMPTGGINEKNFRNYLDFDKIIACGGSWMVKGDLIESGKFDEIEVLSRKAIQTMLGFEIAHVGINEKSEEAANKTANAFENLFGFAKNDIGSSIFTDKYVEVMKTPYLGAKGHIAIATNYINRAVYYLEKKGVVFNEDSVRYLPNGKLNAIYLKEEFSGFAIHLVQKQK